MATDDKKYTIKDMEKAFEAGRTAQDRVYGSGVENKMLLEIYTFKEWIKKKRF